MFLMSLGHPFSQQVWGKGGTDNRLTVNRLPKSRAGEWLVPKEGLEPTRG